MGDWKRIAEFVESEETNGQCNQRWGHASNSSLCEKQWTDEEDRELWKYIEKYSEYRWAWMAELMCYGSDIQCRQRFDRLTKAKKAKPMLRFIHDPMQLSIEESMPTLVLCELVAMRRVSINLDMFKSKKMISCMTFGNVDRKSCVA
jgi:hypothetical protein